MAAAAKVLHAFYIFLIIFILVLLADTQKSDAFDPGRNAPSISSNYHNITSNTRFLMYDVNPGEGFNLRRDVFVRVANLVRYMIDKGEDWILVLAPWRHLYHWKSRYLHQEATPWRYFFDLSSMSFYVPVMEFEEFLSYSGSNGIDHVLYLQRHPDAFKNGWKELIEFADCAEKALYRKDESGKYRGYFWSMPHIYAEKFDCVSAQGHATVLADFLKKLDAKSILADRFEQLLHIHYGEIEFYKARRSLVFAQHLREEGDNFREKYLDSNDEKDKTKYTSDWRKQVPVEGQALGGAYIGVHMRRGDFAHYAHKETVPSIEEIGTEVKRLLDKWNLKKVYLATDGTDEEIKELQSYFKAKIYMYPRPKEVVEKFKDGGIAIIDQWIVAHARYFLGTCQSTFSFRIHEERDILGFSADSTYNCLCGKQSPPDRCHPPTQWRVKF